MGDNNSKEADFPKVFPQCPNCGSEETITKKVIVGMIADGRATKTLRGWIDAKVSAMSPDKPHFTSPALRTIFDVCYDCGIYYCKEVDVATVMPEQKSGGPNVRFGEG